jgi:hypothetical protein
MVDGCDETACSCLVKRIVGDGAGLAPLFILLFGFRTVSVTRRRATRRSEQRRLGGVIVVAMADMPGVVMVV